MAALGLVLPVTAPVLAHAEPLNDVKIIDARGDMWRLQNEARPLAAPKQRRGDIRRTTIRHRQRAITVRTKFVELLRKPQFHAKVVVLRTNAGLLREVNVVAGRFMGRSFYRGIVEVSRRNGRPVDCAVRHRINYATNVTAIRVPRSCLGNPRWAQAKVLSVGVYGARRSPGEFVDTAHGPHHRLNDWSPRLRRP
ncbi:MAG TPA: hypothetical protein VHG70_12655 [Nocardioidaceae bacterium]|nr:hypothetical protein [Nocardioidaceae bacterium]